MFYAIFVYAELSADARGILVIQERHTNGEFLLTPMSDYRFIHSRRNAYNRGCRALFYTVTHGAICK